jgi:hypothetical protein
MAKWSGKNIKSSFSGLVVKYYSALIILIGILFLMIYFNSPYSHAQQRLDLDDLEVKGELQNDDRLNILARERNELRNYVKFRTNFRSEIIEELPQPAPGVKY